MFSYLARLLTRFQSKPIRTAALAALAILVLAILLGSFVRWLRRRKQDRPDAWWSLITGGVGDVLKVLVGLAIVLCLAMHLSFESEEFSRLRGNVTQRSYEAVKNIWGRPHVQREMNVSLVWPSTHYYDKDGMELDIEKIKAASQPVGYRKQTYEHTVPGSAVLSADHHVKLWMNYRKKGGATYPCFETDCLYTYRVTNFSGRNVTAKFNFPMPSRQGLVDKLRVMVDGEPVTQGLVVSESSVTWKVYMVPDAKHDVSVSYHSRGLDHFRFEPGAGRQLSKYRFRMTCKGIPKDRVNYPIGCMTPTELTSAGEETTLVWNLDSAVTRFGMGIIVPKKKQEGYYVARILSGAPWGMILLMGTVLVTLLGSGQKVYWQPLLLLAVAYHLYYLLMAHIGDHLPGVTGGMVIAGAVLTALTALSQFMWNGRFCAAATVAAFVTFCAAYPLIRISDYEGLLLTWLYVAMLAYVIMLVVYFRKKAARVEPQPLSA